MPWARPGEARTRSEAESRSRRLDRQAPPAGTVIGDNNPPHGQVDSEASHRPRWPNLAIVTEPAARSLRRRNWRSADSDRRGPRIGVYRVDTVTAYAADSASAG